MNESNRGVITLCVVTRCGYLDTGQVGGVVRRGICVSIEE